MRLTLEERTVVPVTAWPFPLPAGCATLLELLERAEDDPPTAEEAPLSEERTVVPDETFRSCCWAEPLLRVAELLRLTLLPEEELPPETELFPEERLTELPLVERLELVPETFLFLSCCCAELLCLAAEELLLVAELLRFTEEPLLWLALLPLERVVVPLLERLVELPLERVVELLLERLVLLPPDERDWASISGAMSMATASIMEVAKMENLLIASWFLRVNDISNNCGRAP